VPKRYEYRKAMLDTLDRRIVDALVRDGRRPFVRIAAELGVSEASIRQRVARLTNDGVMQIMAVTNPMKLGFGTVCLIGLTVEKAELEQAAEHLEAFEEVTYLVACTGRYDLLAEVVCRDNAHLLDFLAHRLAGVPGLQSSETFGYLSVLKESYRTSGSDSSHAA
jgi:Lrp/AsnC family transcriptional regulator, regulator for asnA, asnC and gidA